MTDASNFEGVGSGIDEPSNLDATGSIQNTYLGKNLENLVNTHLGQLILAELEQFIVAPDPDSPLHQRLYTLAVEIYQGLFQDENTALKDKSQNYFTLGIKVVGPLKAATTNRILREVINTNYQSWISAVEDLLTKEEKELLIHETSKQDVQVSTFAEALNEMLKIGYVGNNSLRKIVVDTFRSKNDLLNGQQVNLKEIVDKIQFTYTRDYDHIYRDILQHRECIIRAAVAQEFAQNINVKISKVLNAYSIVRAERLMASLDNAGMIAMIDDYYQNNSVKKKEKIDPHDLITIVHDSAFYKLSKSELGRIVDYYYEKNNIEDGVDVDNLVSLVLGSAIYNLNTTELIRLIVDERAQFFDYRCAAWGWEEYAGIPFGNFRLLPKVTMLTEENVAKRLVSIANTLNFFNLSQGTGESIISDLEVETVFNNILARYNDNVASYKSNMQSNMPGVHVNLVSEWLADHWVNYQTMFLHFYHAFEKIVDLGDLSELAFALNSPISREIDVDPIAQDLLVKYFSDRTSREELLDYVQKNQIRYSGKTAIDENMITVQVNDYTYNFNVDCLGLTLRSLANDFAVSFLIRNDNKVQVEAFDDLPRYSANTYLATKILDLPVISFPQSYTIEEQAYNHLIGVEA